MLFLKHLARSWSFLLTNARQPWVPSDLAAFGHVTAAVTQVCEKHGVTIYKRSNNGNHLHLLVKIPSRQRWSAFIRELTGRIAQEVKALMDNKGEKFWIYRPFTRIVRGWRRAFTIAKDYVHLNILEAEGFINRSDTKTLKDLRTIWGDG